MAKWEWYCINGDKLRARDASTYLFGVVLSGLRRLYIWTFGVWGSIGATLSIAILENVILRHLDIYWAQL